MNRTASLTALLCAAVPLTACATFTESDLAARVGDAELDYAEFGDRLDQISESTTDRVAGEDGRAVVSNWVALELARPVGLIDLYESGPTESGVLCVSVVSVADTAAADAAVADLRNGADWAKFVTDIDPLIPLAGRQECLPITEIGEFADQLADLTVDNPYGVLTFPDGAGAVVLRMQQVSDVNGFELLRVYQTVDPELVDAIVASAIDADVYIDPKLGSFDPERFGVAPLG